MTVSELKDQLASQISSAEAEALRNGGELSINDFNRKVCVRLLDNECADETAVPAERIEHLKKELSDYLKQYMADKAEGHKWIILACLYLTYVERLPMHPQSEATWIEKDGKYYCAAMVPESITCSSCVCEKR